MKFLIVAKGGGMGHLSRAGAVGQEAIKRGHQVVLTLGAMASTRYRRSRLQLGTLSTEPLVELLQRQWDVVIVDADPGAFTNRPLPPGPGRRVLIGRHNSRTNVRLSGFSVVYRTEELGFEVTVECVDVEPVILAKPLSGERCDKVLICVRGGGRSDVIHAAKMACVREGFDFDVSNLNDFPAGRLFSRYRTVVASPGMTWHEAQQAGTPGVYIHFPNMSGCDLRGLDNNWYRTPRVASFIGLQNLCRAWESKPSDALKFKGAQQILSHLERVA